MEPTTSLLDQNPGDRELAAAEAQCFGFAWGEADYSGFRRNPLVGAWCLRPTQGEVAAFVLFQLLPDECELLRIGVVPEQRGGGWGREMLTRWLEHCRGQGAQRAFLEVRAGNGSAVRLFRSVGFEQFSMRQGYYSNPREDALLFRADLVAQGGAA